MSPNDMVAVCDADEWHMYVYVQCTHRHTHTHIHSDKQECHPNDRLAWWLPVYVWHEHKLEVAIRQLAPHLATPTTPKHCTVHDVRCAMYIAKCTVHNVKCTVHILQCTLHSALYYRTAAQHFLNL